MNPMHQTPFPRRRNAVLIYLALATLLGLAAITSRPAAAQNFVISDCPAPMRGYNLQLYHGIGFDERGAREFPVCLDRIDLNFDYGGPRDHRGLEPGKFVTAYGLNMQQSDASSNYGEDLDRILAQSTLLPGRADALGAFDLDTFTMVFSGTFLFNGGHYTFTYGSDDGIRVWIDGQIRIDDWNDGSFEFRRKEVWVPAGPRYVVVAFYENRWVAAVYLDWSPNQ